MIRPMLLALVIFALTGDAVPARASAPFLTAGGMGPIPTAPSAKLLVAGDIAVCGSAADARTAELLERLAGVVMTAGDDAYPYGSATNCSRCYGPTWGRFLDRTYPVPGNHEWYTDGASGYFGYFGERAMPEGLHYYAFHLGSWRVYVLVSDCWPVGGCRRDTPQRTGS